MCILIIDMEEYIVSARKYRPKTFDEVAGQEAITSTLVNAINNNQLAQALLFTGPRGVGKTSCARILAKMINSSIDNDKQDFAINGVIAYSRGSLFSDSNIVPVNLNS